MTIASSLVVTVSARTEDFERGMQKTTATLRLTEAQASQVAAGFGNLGQVLTRAGQNGAAGANGIGRMTQSLGGLDAASQKTQGGLGGLGSGISGAMLAVAAVVPQVAGAVIALDLLKKGFEFLAESAVKSQQISATFQGITGSSAEAAQELGFLRDISNQLGFNFQEVAQASQGLIASAKGTTLAGAGVHTVLTGTLTAARALHIPLSDVQGLLLAFSQVMSTGHLTGQDFLQIVQRVPGALAIAARAMGISTSEFVKMREQGIIPSSQFLTRFTTQMEREFGPGAQIAAQGLQAAWARVGNTFRRFGQDIAESGVTDELAKSIDQLNTWIKTIHDAQDTMERVTRERRTQVIPPGVPVTPKETSRIDQIQRDILARERSIAALEEAQRVTSDPGHIVRGDIAAERKALEGLRAEQGKLLKGAQERQTMGDEGLGSFGPSRYVQAVEAEKTVFQAVDDAQALLRKAEAKIQIAVTGEDVRRGLEEKIALFEKMRDTIQAAILLQPGLAKVLRSMGRDELVATGTGQTAFQHVTALDMLSGAEQALAEHRQRLDIFGAHQVQGGLSSARFEELAGAAQRLREQFIQITPAEQTVVAQTQRLITEFEKVHFPEAVGEGTRRVLLGMARDIDYARVRVGLLKDDIENEAEAEAKLIEGLGDAQKHRIRSPAQVIHEDTQEAASKGIFEVTESLRLQTLELSMTKAAWIDFTLAQMGATPAQRAMAQDLLQENEMAKLAASAAETLTDALIEMASTGQASFRSLQESLSRFVLSALAEAIQLKAAAASLIRSALGIASSPSGGGEGGLTGEGVFGYIMKGVGLLGGLTGLGSTDLPPEGIAPTDPTVLANLTAAQSQVGANVGPPMAAGGPIEPNVIHEWQEAGREYFVAGTPGRVMTEEQLQRAGGGGVHVSMTVVTPDVGGFRQSEGQVGAQVGREIMRQMRRQG